MRDLEKDKMKERLDWSFETLKKKATDEGLSVSDDVLFAQASEMARCLFVRSEIQYSAKKQ